MKKVYYIFPALIVVVLSVFFVASRKSTPNQSTPTPIVEDPARKAAQEEPTVSMANPASKYCEESGGELEIITNSDGSQFGMCRFEDYSCEEWAYMNGECTIEEDAEKIEQALIAKGLNLTDMKVVINKHLGRYIGGGVVPVSAPAGGGYVFAVKEDDEIKVLADGNGAIVCSVFEDHPDFPSYLVAECIDETGNPVAR